MTDKELEQKSDDLMRLFFSFCSYEEIKKYINEEDSQDLKDKIELYLEGVDEFG